MGFGSGTVVEVRATGEADWELLREITYEGKWQHFDVPVGAGTDFASVPTVFVWFLPRYGRYTQAAILHDYLWRHEVPAGELTLPEADALFRRAMRELKVPFLRRWIMWAAVRLGALTKPGGRTRWIRDSWVVFPIALPALPIVGPPAIFILLGPLVRSVAGLIPMTFPALRWSPSSISRKNSFSRGVSGSCESESAIAPHGMRDA